VVSNVRNVWKLPASVSPVVELRLELELDDELDWGVVPETTGEAVVALVVAISVSVRP
jgi:hypothetical protein